MDVTSLLNTSSAANLAQRDSFDQTPTPSVTGASTIISTEAPTPSPERTISRRPSGSPRNRTPWDAGGYSLPLKLDMKSIQTMQNTSSAPKARPLFDSPTDTFNPTGLHSSSPRHKFSDSRSSLSSYTSSSTNSGSHSRISSLSTVSEFQPLTSLITDISLDPRLPQDSFDPSALVSRECHRLGLVLDSTAHVGINTTDFIDPALTSEMGAAVHEGGHRLGSPSDAVMIRRRQSGPSSNARRRSHAANKSRPAPSLLDKISAYERGWLDLGEVAPSVEQSGANRHVLSCLCRQPNSPFHLGSGSAELYGFSFGLHRCSSPTESQSGDFSTSPRATTPSPQRGHQRSTSAPEPAVSNMTSLPSMAIKPESPTLGADDYGSAAGVASSMPSDGPDPLVAGPDEDDGFLNDDKTRCLYTENCDTNSQPRKAISHIFGRNKLCTRSIPDNVWVHFCRKHYQRSRYRNAQEYAKTQCNLVEKQISRVQAWSDRNSREGRQGTVQDWSLSIRKREQKRLDDKKANNKRVFRGAGEQDDDDDDVTDRAIAAGTAVPRWLLDKCSNGYSTEDVKKIVQQIKSEMEANRMSQIPDIEILPNVINELPDESKAKTYLKRKTSASSSHKRSQSVGTTLRAQPSSSSLSDSYSISMPRRISQPTSLTYWPNSDEQQQTQYGSDQKRARLSDADMAYHTPSMVDPRMPSRNMDRTVPTALGRMGESLAHRPIRENQTENDFYSDRQYTTQPSSNGGYGYGMMSGGSQGPLPAPNSQRYGDSIAAPQAYGDISMTRPMHMRSYSDASIAFHQGAPVQFRAGGPGSAPQSNASLNSTYNPNGAMTGYAPITQTYDSPPQNAYVQDYMRSDSNGWASNSTPQGPPGYYDDIPARQTQPATQSYMPYYSHNAVAGGSPRGMSGAAKHTRHLSQPVVPRSHSMMQGLASAPQYDSSAYHTRHQSFAQQVMPRLDEAYAGRDQLYDPRR